MPHVYTTGTCDSVYTQTAPSENNLPKIIRKVLIKGGSNVADKRLVTPYGVHTAVSDDDLAFLMSNVGFKKAMDKGFITVRPDEVHPEVAISDMEKRDASAPLVDGDYEDKDGAKPASQRLRSSLAI